MNIAVIVIVIILIIGFACVNKDEEKAKENEYSIEDYLKNKDFKTSQMKTYNQYDNRIQLRTDLEHKQIAICYIFPIEKTDFIKFADIIECEIMEDSNTILKGGIGRAVVGGVLAGGVGAVVGANTRASQNVTNSLKIRIITKNISRSLYTINIITAETQKDSKEYKEAMNFANEVYSTITSIINNSNNEKNNNNLGGKKDMEQSNNDFIEQLERLSKLKENGVITQEEFEESKQKILNSTSHSNTMTTSQDNTITNNNDIYHIEEKIYKYGENEKIKIIGEVMKETGKGLAESKEIVENYLKNR